MFKSARQALAFLSRNPARQKSINLLEFSYTRKPIEQFSGSHETDIWAQIVLAARSALIDEPFDVRLAFNFCEVGRPLGERLCYCDAAKILHKSPRQIRYSVNRVLENFERELKYRNLLEE